ncbi:ATP-binding protein [Snuella sedimenti]|uniref:histidine kinase n=1 Tax=Snuella sedimenti TaxID=2798802 RepID=A0A8J7IGA0_9FLAO|nr:ATP-binding protein [Snuella sedimenti]MBJ6367323.1 response regulator [Snuella sedimenti]
MALLRINFSLNTCIWILLCVQLTAQNRMNFNHLAPELDNQVVQVNKSIQDTLGYIWFSNKKGLYRYDGYNLTFTPFSHYFGATFSNRQKVYFNKDLKGNFWLASNRDLLMINLDGSYKSFKKDIGNKDISVIESNEDTVYFGTTLGDIYNYNHEKNTVDRLVTLPKINNQPQTILDLAFTKEKKIWISTDVGNIYNFLVQNDELIVLKTPFNNTNTNTNQIKLVSDKKDNLWIATELYGVFQYDIRTKVFKEFNAPINRNNSKYPMYLSLFCDRNGDIWAGTDGDGLFKIDSEKGSIYTFKHNKSNRFSISDNSITHINEDSFGNLWLIDKKGVVNVLPYNNSKIKYYSGSSNNTPTVSLCVLKASDESLWIGTDGEGISRVFSDGNSIQYSNSSKGNNYFDGRYILQITEATNKNIWIATYQNGLFVYDIKLNKFNKVELKDEFGKPYLHIRFVFKDSKNRIWAGHRDGIHLLDENQNIITIFNFKSNELSGKILGNIIETKNGEIWLSSNQGDLYFFEENNNKVENSTLKIINYHNDNENQNYNITHMSEDMKGNLWLIIKSDFLIRLNTNNYTYESFENSKSLKDIGFHNVIVDDSNRLWLGGSNGLHQYIPETGTIKSFYEVDGLQGNAFTRGGAYKDKAGVLYFAGNKGVSSFDPNSIIKKNNPTANLFINQIDVLNRPANTIIPEQLTGGIEKVKSLKLKPDQSSFSFQFSVIENVLNSNFYYAYKLNGFDKDWIVSREGRVATYTNIPPGNYVFEVKAGSKKGIWDINPKKININIAQPIWKTPWAYGIYSIILILVAYAIYLWVKLKKKFVTEELNHKNEKELYALKMNFFAKMSHEIQTPLTLISGPIESLLENAIDSGNNILKQRLSIILNNAKRLSKIVFELTTIRNKELGQLRLRVSKNNIISDLKNITLSFKEQADFKKINFRCYYPDTELMIWYDKDKVEHIFYNLLANAFKFTPKKGTIDFEVKILDFQNMVKISVIDSGPGISKDELANIFELFYQSDIGKKSIGTGIGLALTKELVKLHKGKIDVESTPEKGTCFSVYLSTNENEFSDEQKIFDIPKKPIIESKGTELLDDKDRDSKLLEKTILIVEDNYEMQFFLEDIFKNQYNILIADDGEEGLYLAKKHIPDLIISDIMMPNKDGLEMCSALVKNKVTSHIPIILLTAKESPKAKLLGLMSGAIEYINKPFNSNELIFSVHNIISRSEKLLSKYKIDLISTPKHTKTISPEDAFLQNIMSIVEVEYKNPNFKLEEISDSLNMSYSTMYRKFQSITGKTLVDFVRSVRLKKAAILIIKYNYTISEATFLVGLNDPKYFIKCFKKKFNMTPGKFKKQAQANGTDIFIEKYNLEQMELEIN